MFDRIRRRLTLGYVGIFALILVILGIVAVALLWREADEQQDELLSQKARGTLDYVVRRPLESYQQGLNPEGRPPPPPPHGDGNSTTNLIRRIYTIPPLVVDGAYIALLRPLSLLKRFGLPMSRLEIFKVMGCYLLLRERLARGRLVLH